MAEEHEAASSPDVDKTVKATRRTFVGVLLALFGALNIVVFGRQAGWWTPRLKVHVAGPFADGETIALDVANNAVTILKRRSENLVVARSVKLQRRDDGIAKMNIAFSFQGEKKSSRLVVLSVTLRDAAGGELGRAELLCTDGRISAERPQRFGTFIVQQSPINSEAVKIPIKNAADISAIAAIDLVFENA